MIFGPCSLFKKKKRAPKGFKGHFSHLLEDISLLFATAIHLHFRMPVVLRLNKTFAETVMSARICEMKSLMEANSEICESNNENDNEQDFFKVQLIFKRMSNPVK